MNEDRFYVDCAEYDGHINYMIRDRTSIYTQRRNNMLPGRPFEDIHVLFCTGMTETEARFVCARLNA